MEISFNIHRLACTLYFDLNVIQYLEFRMSIIHSYFVCNWNKFRGLFSIPSYGQYIHTYTLILDYLDISTVSQYHSECIVVGMRITTHNAIYSNAHVVRSPQKCSKVSARRSHHVLGMHGQNSLS